MTIEPETVETLSQNKYIVALKMRQMIWIILKKLKTCESR